MKEGQIYEYEGKERFVLTNISSKRLCAIYQSGIVINLERFSPQMKVYGKLIAEYPIWQQAVNSKEFKNIDCGKTGYKTPREIELEKKLAIAVKALEDIKSYAPSCFNKDDCPLFNENCGCISEGGCFALASYLALAKIKEVEE